jgi:hypothetical protein
MLGWVRRVGSPEARKPSGSRRSATAAETGSNPTLATRSGFSHCPKNSLLRPLNCGVYCPILCPGLEYRSTYLPGGAMKCGIGLAVASAVLFSVPAEACPEHQYEVCVFGACFCVPEVDLPGCPDHNCGPRDPGGAAGPHLVFSAHPQFPAIKNAPPKKIQESGTLEVCFWEHTPGQKPKETPTECTAVTVSPDNPDAAAK